MFDSLTHSSSLIEDFIFSRTWYTDQKLKNVNISLRVRVHQNVSFANVEEHCLYH